MKKGRNDLLNIFKVVFSNFSLLGAGVVTSFVLPAFLSMEDFGYYKIFNLYVTYIIILQFGVVESLYMKYGGKNFNDVDKTEFSGYFRTLLRIEIAIGIVLVAVGFLFLKDDVRFICISLALNIVIVNITNLYQYLSQAIQRFSELSARNVAKAVFTVISVLAVFFVSRSNPDAANYKIIVSITVAINFLLMLWYIFTYRKLFVHTKSVSWDEFKCIVKLGFPLCLANIIATLILNISRQIVSMFFSTTDYATYSFAYSLLTLISTVVASVAVVMFSMFKKQETKKLLARYSINVKIVSMLMAFSATVYFPMCWFVRLALPDYEYSLGIFRIVIPGLILSSSITIVMHNYFKTLEQNIKFFVISLIVLVLSLISGIGAYYIFGTMESISWASVIVTVGWYVLSEHFLFKKYKVSSGINIVYLIVISAVFYGVSLFNMWYIGMIVYLIATLMITGLFYHREIKNLFSR